MEFVNLKKTLGLVFIFIMIPLWAMSQNITVKGNVKEASGDALPGVSIQQVGASTGTVTDLDGNFSISVPTNAKLTFSYVGYNSQTVPVAGKRTLKGSSKN